VLLTSDSPEVNQALLTPNTHSNLLLISSIFTFRKISPTSNNEIYSS